MAEFFDRFVAQHFPDARRSGSEWKAHCPAHDDHNPSLSISEGRDGCVLLTCRSAQCDNEKIVAALGLTMRDLFPPKPSHRGITVEELAADKGLPADYLRACGVEQNGSEVHITYRLMDNSLAPQQRRRTMLKAKKGSWWLKDKGSPVPYGLWLLAKMCETSDTLTLVEGESDSWTLWRHKIAALGIPGADMAKTLGLSHVESFPRLQVFQEPDKGGHEFVHGARGVVARLREIGYKGQVTVLKPPAGLKDPNDIFKHDPAGFLAAWEELTARAEEAPEPKPDPAVTPGLSTDSINLTDLGNARRLARRHGQDLRYCRPHKEWLVWDGTRWKPDDTGELEKRAKETIGAMYIEAAEISDRRDRENLVRHALSSEKGGRIREMIGLAASEPGIPVTPQELDRNPDLLNVLNGTLDLRTGELLPHRREDLMTKIAPVVYDPEAHLGTWDKLLSDAAGGDQDLVAFLQRAIGYSLTGKTSEEVLFFVHGPTATGKSTFLEAVKAALGDYSATADFETFLARSFVGSPRDDVASLEGARFVVSIEVDQGKRLAEGLVKLITGGDQVAARRLYHSTSTFLPTLKLWLAANHAPKVSSEDGAMWRRIIRIPFERIVPKDKRDPRVKEALRDPAVGGPAILAWAVQGCLAWRKQGLAVPALVEKATDDYRASQDLIGGFLEDCCAEIPAAVTPVSSIYATYVKWCGDNGDKPLAVNKFSQRVSERGFAKHRSYSEGRCLVGLALIDSRPGDEKPPLLPEAPQAGKESDAAEPEPF